MQEQTGFLCGAAARGPLGRIMRFSRNEDGAMIIFGIYMLVLMLMIGGLAIDVVRFEHERSRLQGTLDRAVLAAASLNQSRPPKEVVNDYVAKAGLEEYLDEPVVNANTLNARSVTATATAQMPTVFMKLLNIDTLAAGAASTAEERVSNVEISLVLDISNSMIVDNVTGAQRDRLKNLKVAAKEFVDIVMAGANTGLDGAPMVSVSIVPYSGQVNIGPDLWNTFPNAQYGQSYSHCVDFDESDFKTTALPTSTALVGSGNAEHYASTSNPQKPTFYWCPEHGGTADPRVTAFSHDPDKLKAAIEALEAAGSTAIDTGMKWGVTLLDPTLQASVSSLVDDGLVNSAFLGRPLSHEAENKMKVIVLMTDGEHVNTEPRLANGIKTGLSDVWLSGSPGDEVRNWSLKLSNGKYYWKRTGTKDNATADVQVSNTSCSMQSYCTKKNWWNQCIAWGEKEVCTSTATNATATRLSYPDLWHEARVGWVAGVLYAGAGIANKYAAWVTNFQPSEKDQRTKNICDAARAKKITVYSIAFEAEPGGEALLKYCASTSGHYYKVYGEEIRSAFRSIASHITQLRLTQ